MLAQELLRAHPHRDGEVLDLLPGVVVVELARHVGALPFDEARERVAQRRLPAVPDVQRSGRIGRDELDHHALAAPGVAAAEPLALGEDVPDHRLPRRAGDEDVDEPGAGDLDLLHQIGGRQRGHQRLREFARISLQRLCVLERDIRREVAVLRLLRAIELDERAGALRRDGGEPAGQIHLELGTKIHHRGPPRIGRPSVTVGHGNRELSGAARAAPIRGVIPSRPRRNNGL